MRTPIAAMTAIVAIASLMAPGAVHAQPTKVKIFDIVGPWRVLAVWKKAEKTHLACSAYFKLDERLGRLYTATFSKDSNNEWKIEFRRENWPALSKSIEQASLIDLDTNKKISNTAPIYRDKMIAFPIGNTPEAIQKFQKKKRLYISLKSPDLNTRLKLPSTQAVIDRINACHKHHTK